MKSYSKLICIFFCLISLVACQSKSRTDLSNLSAPELLATAKEAIEDSNYETALNHLREIEARFPYGVYAQQAMLETAYLYHKQGDPELTVAAADRFIYTYPTHENVDYAYYLKGLSNYTTSRNFISKFTGSKDFSDRDPQTARQSFDAFKELVTRFPESRYAEDSVNRMEALLKTIAKHDTNIAKFYLERGAYVAVVNRCKQVIEQYQNTPAVEDALGMMVIAYREMGLDDLARDSWRVLQTNFPNSRYLSELNT